jgi:hypothetical protein
VQEWIVEHRIVEARRMSVATDPAEKELGQTVGYRHRLLRGAVSSRVMRTVTRSPKNQYPLGAIRPPPVSPRSQKALVADSFTK